MKNQLLRGECLEFYNEDDLLHLLFIKSTSRFLAILNAKPMFSLKTFNQFEKRVNKLANEKGIKISD